MNGRIASFVAVCLLVAATLSAQTAPTPRVTKATGFGPGGSAGLGHRLTLDVQNFDALLQAAGSCGGIMLFIDDRPMYGTKAMSCDAQTGRVHFILDRDPDNDKSDEVWHAVLGRPKRYMREARVSVGPNDQFVYPSSATFQLFIIPRLMLWIFLGVLAAGIILFVSMCRRTTMIRSPVVMPPGAVAPYSLSRFQMAWWFFLVIAGYTFMWMITGELDTISESILALIGIGAGTALGAAVIDAPPAPNAQPSPPPPPSEGFLRDILSDGLGSVSFHRFQMFAWTVILGMIFIISVWEQLSMPEFSATLLGLMGISSGTYLGFKLPEKKNEQIAAGTDPATAGTPPPAS